MQWLLEFYEKFGAEHPLLNFLLSAIVIIIVGFAPLVLLFNLANKRDRMKSDKLLANSDLIDSIISKYPGIVKHFGIERNKLNVLPELIFKRRVWNALPSELRDTEPLICFPPDIELNASSFLTTFDLPKKALILRKQNY